VTAGASPRADLAEGHFLMTTVRWQPDRARPRPTWPVPPLSTAMARGFNGRCPACGKTHLFNGFLKVVPVCRSCGVPLGLARADDAPPYFVILITGHIVIPLLLLTQKFANPPDWVMAAIFLPLTLALALALLRPTKGVVVGVILALDMLKSEPKFG
jgi:uncharacterized protein (DUF983 family)